MRALFSSSRKSSIPTTVEAPQYRLIYFDTRGAAEPIRLLLSIAGASFEDMRYPMAAAAKGFTLSEDYIKDRDAGAYAINMNSLPALQISERGATFTLGQSASIVRYLGHRHGLMGATPLETATVDCLYECVRDIKSSWFKVKSTPDDGNAPAGEARREAKQRWWSTDLPVSCLKLEGAVSAAMQHDSLTTSGPWLVGSRATIADVAVYHLLSTPTSLVSGSTVSFMDNEGEGVRSALAACPRLSAAVAAVGAIPAVRAWENSRPDTFS